MDSDEFVGLVKQLDQEGRLRLYIGLALQLTIRAREAYAYDIQKAVETLRGLNELTHSVLGQGVAINSNAPRTRDEEVAARMFGFAEKLGVAVHLSLALDAVPRGLVLSKPSS